MEINFDRLIHSYSNEIFNKKIFIIGLYPPPLGGIPIHISRAKQKLIKQNNTVKVIDVIKESSKRSKLEYLIYLCRSLFIYKPEIVHYHTLTLRKNLFELVCLVIIKLFLNYKLETIIHTPRFFYQKNWFYKKKFNLLSKFVNRQILIGSSTYEAFIHNNLYLKNCVIESPFIEPDVSQEFEITSKYPQALLNFYDSHNPIIIINGSQIKIWQNIDLYGFDIAINLINHLEPKFENIGLLIAVSSKGDEEYFQKIKSIADAKKNIYLYLETNLELWPLIKRSNILIRPTANDSYAISVAEAIFFNVPAIASDVCVRSDKTITFKSRDQDEFNLKVKGILANQLFINESYNSQNRNKINNISNY